MTHEKDDLREGKLNFQDDVIKDDKFKIMSANVQGLNNKFQNIRDLVHDLEPSFLCPQETWGKKDIKDNSIRFYHKPHIVSRPGEGMNLGGGMGIWVRSHLYFEIIKSPFLSKVFLWFKRYGVKPIEVV